MDHLNKTLINSVACLLAQQAATHPEFMFHVVNCLQDKGYELQAAQRGFAGTYLRIQKIVQEKAA